MGSGWSYRRLNKAGHELISAEARFMGGHYTVYCYIYVWFFFSI